MIGYAEKLVDYFRDQRPKKAQSIPASLFWRTEPLGIYRDSNSKNVSEFLGNGGLKGLQHVPFDLFISETHKLSYRVGDHPMQNGVTISDHVRRELREVTIEGMLTNHPLKPLEETNEVKFKDEYATSEVKPTITNRALEMFNKIKLVAEAKKPVRLVCSLEVYPKMVITEINYERNAKSGSSIRFTMTLREIVQVDLQSTTQDIAFDPKKMINDNDKAIKALCETGKQSSQEASPEKLTEMVGVSVGTAEP